MLDCRSTQALLQRYVTGARTSDGDLERALGHVMGCKACRRRLPALERALLNPAELQERAALTELGLER